MKSKLKKIHPPKKTKFLSKNLIFYLEAQQKTKQTDEKSLLPKFAKSNDSEQNLNSTPQKENESTEKKEHLIDLSCQNVSHDLFLSDTEESSYVISNLFLSLLLIFLFLICILLGFFFYNISISYYILSAFALSIFLFLLIGVIKQLKEELIYYILVNYFILLSELVLIIKFMYKYLVSNETNRKILANSYLLIFETTGFVIFSILLFILSFKFRSLKKELIIISVIILLLYDSSLFYLFNITSVDAKDVFDLVVLFCHYVIIHIITFYDKYTSFVEYVNRNVFIYFYPVIITIIFTWHLIFSHGNINQNILENHFNLS